MKNSGTRFNYNEYKPPIFLRRFIDKIWIFESSDEPGDIKDFGLIPDYTSSLICILPAEHRELKLFITGPNSASLPLENFTDQITFGFRFYSYNMPSLFGLNPAETINSEIIPGIFTSPGNIKPLMDSLSAAANMQQRISAISQFLKPQLEKADIYSDEISTIISMIINSEGAVKLEEIYAALTISQRQFQRNFGKRTGLSPKEFCKLVRFHSVTRKLVKNNFRHFDTLVESGYYDQSHYYREFKEFIGMLPTRFELRQKRISHENLLG